MRSIGAKKINHMFTHLRKIAQHPLLIRHHYDDASVEEIAKKAFEHNLFSGNATLKRVTDELLGYSDFGLHAFCYGAGPDFEGHRLSSIHLLSSTKFRFLADLLPRLKEEGSRPLIFSQWTAVLDVIEWLMEDLMLPYVRLDGSTAVDERLATVDRFNNSDDVFAFLLSTRAGGQGLNLTGADTVILHDVDFNPQIDRQAEDRCHRLGQTKPVMVYRLVTKSSVDQNIYNLSQRKLKLDAAVLDGITTGRGAKQRQNAQERQQMGFILRSLFAGEEDYAEMMEGEKKDNDNLIELSKDAEQEIKKEAEGERGPEDNTVAT
jgi:SWI/SNF-related matrix-associated actin-dependent regulator 1 of chromatin subfamily A